MAGGKTFTLTLSNNVTEKQGINYLVDKGIGFFRIDLETKKQLLDLLNIERRFLQSFDLIYLPNQEDAEINEETVIAYIEDMIFIELKTTKKYLPENPKGFFFGATENEFNFGKILGEKFRFCFVTLNEKNKSFALLTIEELEKIIKNKRIQYQINL